MNHTRIYLLASTALALGHWGAPALANATPAADMEEVSDAELGDMRGRYVMNDNTVAWFGVKMISTWRTDSGQMLQSTLALNMDFSVSDIHPTISFEPSVTITRIDDPLPATREAVAGTRSVDGSGLANVSGVRQSVQVAGDDNHASNVTRLTVSDDADVPLPAAAGNGPALATDSASAQNGNASALASFDGHSARVLLTIEGQGAVEQWIRSGSVGQSVQLTTDNQWVSNRMEIELVRRSVSTSVQMVQNVAQAIHLARGIGESRF